MIKIILMMITIVIISIDGLPLHKVMYPTSYQDQFGAQCLDGTEAGYYFRQSNAKSNELGYNGWVIYLQGGGVCAEPIDCEARKFTVLGSSKKWQDIRNVDHFVLSDNAEMNPFASWNHVFVPYCTGDTHTGTMTGPDLMGFRFSGHNNLEALLDHLTVNFRLANATNVLFTGSSAGGIGVFNNADFMKSKFPKATFRAAPKAGYFFPSNILPFETWIVDADIHYPEIAAEYLSNWYHSYLDESCVAATPTLPGRCWDASFVYPHIEADMFLFENIFDASLLGFLGWVDVGKEGKEYLAYFGDTMVASIQQVKNSTKPRDGFFMPSCYDHTGNLCVASETKVHGYKFVDVIGDWYFQKNVIPHQLIDACWKEGSLPCNPECPQICNSRK
eukprot:TRINITY_DN3464_c0_g1_i1.p1 TRINITY_DN3464_c0_g1~~TRINITY_DN3464_c0_g1_i1.p1  ORF type:complete len:389 (-),score=69.44 TRINITY_DN3464_c0_g1_i1:336-1502(-)